jgi:C-terminal peptidase prc
MKKRILFGFLILTLMACNFASNLLLPATPTPIPSPTATFTPSPTATPSPTPTPLQPVYIPPECEGKALATVAPEVLPTSQVELNTILSTREKIEIFERITKIIDDVYVYPDFNGKDWEGIKAKYRKMIESGLDTEQFYTAMRDMIFELGDEHSNFLSPLEADETLEQLRGRSEYVGIGIVGNPKFEEGKIVVISVLPDSAAEYAGLKSHDSILLVDGLPITAEGGLRLRGPACSVVNIRVQSPGGEPRDLALMRYRIEGGPALEARLVPTTDGSKVGYIYLPSFFDETLVEQMEDALNEFGKLDGLIIDLRFNGGGSSSVAYPIMEFFTDGVLGEFVSRTESRTLEIHANEIQNSQSVPLIILVGEDSVSFGELFPGVMQDSGRAKIVGRTTLGNVEVLHGYQFDDGSLMWIASETFHSAFSNSDWERTGIIPDVEAFAEWETFLFETDPAIAASLALFGFK